jgi:hypothetical protein
MTFSHHLASFNGIQMQNAESLPHLKMVMQAIELLGTRVAHALRKELEAVQVIKKEFNKISKLGYIEHIVEFVYILKMELSDIFLLDSLCQLDPK